MDSCAVPWIIKNTGEVDVQLLQRRHYFVIGIIGPFVIGNSFCLASL